MNVSSRWVRQLSAVVALSGSVLLTGARHAPRIDPCSPQDEDRATCGYTFDCFYAFDYPNTCGEGAWDICYVEGGTVYYEGWCWPDADCNFQPQMC